VMGSVERRRAAWFLLVSSVALFRLTGVQTSSPGKQIPRNALLIPISFVF